jgi:DNA-binding response OmpR family regulator
MTSGASAGGMDDAIARIWERSRPLVVSRVEAVEHAAMSLLGGALDAESRQAAMAAAHALAGTAGSFGFARASTLAREAEVLLEGSATVESNGVLRLSTIALELRHDLVDAALPARSGRVFDGAATPSAPAPESASIDAPLATIVAVDDDPAIIDLLSVSLAVKGIAVHGVNDPRQAVETIAERQPELVILDVDMPGLDGIALCRQLRADDRTVAVPIVFVTSHNEPTVVRALFDAGADDHLTKPIDVEMLVARLASRLARARQVRQSGVTAAMSRALVTGFTTDVALVDDDVVLTALLSYALTARGHTVTICGDGPDAVAQLAGASPPVRAAVILLDVSLPGLDGFAVLRALARDGVTRRSHVMMLTARTVESEVLQALELGARDHISKPFSIPVLLQRIRGAVESAGATR